MLLFLDTETTGLSASAGDRIVELAIVDESGRTMIDTLVDPRRPIPGSATQIHGITDRMVRGSPTLDQLMPDIRRLVRGNHVVIYNAAYDAPFFPERLGFAAQISCAMRRYAEMKSGRWVKLEVAAQAVGHRWTGEAHRALADTLACRSVWNWLSANSEANRRFR